MAPCRHCGLEESPSSKRLPTTSTGWTCFIWEGLQQRTLAEMAALQTGQHVLDVGAGVGGPARRMAYKHGARLRVWN